MTTGYILLGSGTVVLGLAVIMTVFMALTARSAKQKIEKRMAEKY